MSVGWVRPEQERILGLAAPKSWVWIRLKGTAQFETVMNTMIVGSIFWIENSFNWMTAGFLQWMVLYVRWMKCDLVLAMYNQYCGSIHMQHYTRHCINHIEKMKVKVLLIIFCCTSLLTSVEIGCSYQEIGHCLPSEATTIGTYFKPILENIHQWRE